jgi:hypothetical protein
LANSIRAVMVRFSRIWQAVFRMVTLRSDGQRSW